MNNDEKNNQGETNGYTDDANIVSQRAIQSLSDVVQNFISDTPLRDIFQGLEPRFKDKCVLHGGLIRKILRHYYRNDLLSLRRKFLSGNIDLDTVICVSSEYECIQLLKYLTDKGFVEKTSNVRCHCSYEEYYCRGKTFERERIIFLGKIVMFSLPLEQGEIKLDVSILLGSEYNKLFRDDADFLINSLYFKLADNLLRFRGLGYYNRSKENLFLKMFAKILNYIRLDCSPPTRGLLKQSARINAKRILKFDAVIVTKDSNNPMIILWGVMKNNNIPLEIIFQIYSYY
jgi:hypothetical protein